MPQNQIARYLEEHPRMMGVLFTATLLFMEVGTVMAAAGTSDAGP